ncbi:hypothetical protein Acsp04_15810 [Actinomadura sp. NBRC 104425]|nr:hypothetical protein Acsp04_15810 [Actinomadura sp. NBRC 104425]
MSGDHRTIERRSSGPPRPAVAAPPPATATPPVPAAPPSPFPGLPPFRHPSPLRDPARVPRAHRAHLLIRARPGTGSA